MPPPSAPAQIINGGKPFLPVDALRRGTASYGSGQRMERLGQKLLAGEPVTVTFLGGSITWGRVSSTARGGGRAGHAVMGGALAAASCCRCSPLRRPHTVLPVCQCMDG